MNLTARYSGVHGFLWAGYSGVIGFSSVYLLGVGFTNTQIGVISAVSSLISAILQPMLATYADKPSSPSIRKILTVLSLICIGLSTLMLFVQGSLVLTSLFLGTCIAFLMLMTPLVNSLGAESINQGKSLNYGIARGIGSLGYGAGAFIIGRLVEKISINLIPVSMSVLFIGFLVTLFLFPFQKEIKTQTEQLAGGGDGLLYFIRRYRKFAVSLAGCILLYTSHVLINNFGFQIVESKGGNSATLGSIMALCAYVELPTMFLFSSISKKAKPAFWFRLAGIFMALKAVCSLLAPTIPVYYAVQLLQMFGWGLISVASVYYVNYLMDAKDVIKGQAYMTTTYTIGTVLGALIGGPIIDHAGVRIMILVSAVLGLAGMLIVLTAGEDSRPSNTSSPA